MRILQIRLKNMNSLRGEHKIDFTQSPFREAGLFGIVGATGSGKSTLLDSITLAIYGKVPRIGAVGKGIIERSGVVLTKHEKECFAEVTYSCRKGTFTSRWSISTTRNNTLRDAVMELFNEAGEMIGAKSDVAFLNTDHIGLDYDQFVKSILLCQGDFAIFLKSDKNKRAELLEKITGTHEFRKIGMKAFREYSSRRKELDVLEKSLELINQGLLDPEARAQLEVELAGLAIRLDQLNRELETARQVLEKKNRLVQLRTALDTKKGLLQEATGKEKAFMQEYGEAMRHYDALKGFRQDLDEHARLGNKLEELSEKLKTAESSTRALELQVSQLVSGLKALVREEVSAEDFIQHLNELRDKVTDANARSQQLRETAKSSGLRIAELLKRDQFAEVRGLFRKDGDNDAFLMKLRNFGLEAEAGYKKTISELGVDVATLPGLKQEMQARTSHLHELLAEVKAYRLVNQRITQGEQMLKTCLAEVVAIAKAEQEAALELEELNGKLQVAEREKQEMLMASSTEELRKTLADGKPCPVCGSIHHPYLHQFAEQVVARVDRYEKLKAEVDEKAKSLEDLRRRHDAAKNKAETEQRNKELAEQEIGLHINKIEELKQKVGVTEVKSESAVTELLGENESRLRKLELCLSFRSNHPILQSLVTEVESFDETTSLYNAALAELNQLYAGDDFQLFYQKNSSSMTQFQKDLAATRQQWKSSSAEIEKERKRYFELQSKLDAALREKGYASPGQARQQLVTEEEQGRMHSMHAQVNLALTRAKAGVEEVSQLLARESEGDDEALTAAEQQSRVNEIRASITECATRRDLKMGELATDDSRLASIRETQEKRQKMLDAIKPWAMLNKLIGSKDGDVFNRFAQDLTLEKLLILANRRLEKLHSRYALKLPKDDDDLRVADGYMGGEVRTVKSLSGGETFMLSLALALGLSDLASRDIKIDSLFIDEGFGSLDPETLEEAMTTLEQLQAEQNKTVGIISHVESLKERIYTQIRLEKGNNGFSTMSVFPEPGKE